ncbi:hypothetical protein GCM10022394_25750 [Zobellella aerophila]|uniref:Uncharacterized protein n=1 Tax=Zobellella aerophila TaxID=870480 RepID=A0ABP6W4M7_9GAMM
MDNGGDLHLRRGGRPRRRLRTFTSGQQHAGKACKNDVPDDVIAVHDDILKAVNGGSRRQTASLLILYR